MAWYEISYACGHEGREQVYGNASRRQWLVAKKAEGDCPECYQLRLQSNREKESLKAADEAKELGLPELIGTPKQVSWAQTCRMKLIDRIQQTIEKADFEMLENPEEVKKTTEMAFQSIMANDSAVWWIDNRDLSTDRGIIQLLERQYNTTKNLEKNDVITMEKKEIEAETTVRPENPVTETVAEIKVVDSTIQIVFPEIRDDFRRIVKEDLSMRWADIVWQRKIIMRNGSVEDRAAECGHRLLASGIPIRIADQNIRKKAINGEYRPECIRWILARIKGQYEGWLHIDWKRPDDFYKAARKISGSRYSDRAVVVPPEQFEEVLDFASMYNFEISESAKKVIEAARMVKHNALVVSTKETPSKRTTMVADGKPPILDVPEDVSVDAEFRDHN